MGYPTKVQLIRRKASEQWYINFPAALAGTTLAEVAGANVGRAQHSPADGAGAAG